ncbi:MAG: hypothetical protein AB7V46_04350 [Thermomicrobiales bacterium]
MKARHLAEGFRIPVLFTIALWFVTFLMMAGLEAIWYLDEHLLAFRVSF